MSIGFDPVYGRSLRALRDASLSVYDTASDECSRFAALHNERCDLRTIVLRMEGSEADSPELRATIKMIALQNFYEIRRKGNSIVQNKKDLEQLGRPTRITFNLILRGEEGQSSDWSAQRSLCYEYASRECETLSSKFGLPCFIDSIVVQEKRFKSDVSYDAEIKLIMPNPVGFSPNQS